MEEIRGTKKEKGTSFAEIVSLLESQGIKFSDYQGYMYKDWRSFSGMTMNLLDRHVITESRAKNLLHQTFGHPQYTRAPSEDGIESEIFTAEFDLESFPEFAGYVAEEHSSGLVGITKRGKILQETTLYYNDVNADMKSRTVVIVPEPIKRPNLEEVAASCR